jgi:UDP-glucose 4-epimerase
LENAIRYLITGGAGFIGSSLCEFLVDKGHSVFVVDDLSTGYKNNLAPILKSITFYEEKIQFFDFEILPKIDAVIHLAAQPSVPISIADFRNSSSGNILGTIKIIDYCSINQIPLTYASSSAIYGNLELGSDVNSEIDLLSPYATDKYVMELYAKTAFKLYKLSSIGLRFFNVYGPRQDPNSPYSGVISIFIDRLLKGQNITINGGYQTRDFIYVNDVVEIIFQSTVLTSGKQMCEHSNVLTGNSVSIDYLAKMLINQIEQDVDINYQALSISDPEKSSGSIKKMTELFGVDLKKMIPLNSGLSKTVDFIRDNN